mmetsp:Transcript_49498/g.160410  ORF Transcript_49498/g.160410 Transcript_49498/m.160410 type:complete len:227 (-) Transcript_49498:93-773(-)
MLPSSVSLRRPHNRRKRARSPPAPPLCIGPEWHRLHRFPLLTVSAAVAGVSPNVNASEQGNSSACGEWTAHHDGSTGGMFLFNSSTNATKTLLDSPTRLADGKARRDVVAGNAVEGVEERKCRRFCEGLKSKHVLPSPSPQSVQRAWLQSTIAALPSPEVPVAEPLRSTDDLPPPQSASPPPPLGRAAASLGRPRRRQRPPPLQVPGLAGARGARPRAESPHMKTT